MAETNFHTAVVGVSLAEICGVHAHAGLLAGALEREGQRCSEHWLLRRERAPRAARGEVRAWTDDLARTLSAESPDALLLHYSVFSYCYRGLPLFVAPVLAALRRTRVPLVAMLHELAYPWGLRGWRGSAWALTQRALLIEVMRSARATAVTTDYRVRWLRSRPWLARRPVALAPVFSNLPAPRAATVAVGEAAAIGLFGYAYEERTIALVLGAVRALEQRGLRPRLRLLGTPGAGSALAERWRRAAQAQGLAQPPCFVGPLPAQELADALGACDVLLFADSPGPVSRKGTLAGALASGRPLVALDGPHTWQELVRAEALWLVPRSARALADAVAELLGDERERTALGVRGQRFAEQRMGLALSAAVVGGMLREAAASHPSSAARRGRRR